MLADITCQLESAACQFFQYFLYNSIYISNTRIIVNNDNKYNQPENASILIQFILSKLNFMSLDLS